MIIQLIESLSCIIPGGSARDLKVKRKKGGFLAFLTPHGWSPLLMEVTPDTPRSKVKN